MSDEADAKSNFDKITSTIKRVAAQVKESKAIKKMFSSVGSFIVGAVVLIIALYIGLALLGVVLAFPWMIVEIILEHNDVNVSLSDGERVVAGIATYISIVLVVLFISWLFTGSPPLLAFFSRIICLSGIVSGIVLLNTDLSDQLIQNMNGKMHESIIQLIKDPIIIIGMSFGLGLASELVAGVHKTQTIETGGSS